MYYLYIVIFLILAYLSGSVNYAIIISRLVAKKEIRDIGNLNAGTMNVLRSIGKKWGILVGILDSLKSFVPMLIAKHYLLSNDAAFDSFVLLLIGVLAVAGHCWPVFYGFKGGRGVGPIIGLFVFFAPAEFIASMVLGIIIVAVFFKNVEFRWGRWVPMMFIIITPFLTTGLIFIDGIHLFGSVFMGGHPWYTAASVWGTSLFMGFVNFTFMGERVVEYKDSVEEG